METLPVFEWMDQEKDFYKFLLEVDDMIRSSNKGYIMLRSIIGFGFADDECLRFSDCQTHILQRSAGTGQGGIRVLYEEVQCAKHLNRK